MIITNDAKFALENILDEQQADNIRLFFVGTCGETPVGISLDRPKKEDVIEVVNGIKVAIEPKAQPYVTDVTISIEDGPHGKALVLEGLETNECC